MAREREGECGEGVSGDGKSVSGETECVKGREKECE